MITIMGNPRQYKIPDWFLNRQKDVKDGKYSQVLFFADHGVRVLNLIFTKILNNTCCLYYDSKGFISKQRSGIYGLI